MGDLARVWRELRMLTVDELAAVAIEVSRMRGSPEGDGWREVTLSPASTIAMRGQSGELVLAAPGINARTLIISLSWRPIGPPLACPARSPDTGAPCRLAQHGPSVRHWWPI